jgi:radical SAM protein with 4Fe4S-binding SPASM domain
VVKIAANTNFHTVTNRTVFDIKTDMKFNEYRRKWKENPEKFIVDPFPLHLDIESTSACNLRCPFCASTANTWGYDKKGYMDFSLYKKIVDEGAENGLCALKLSLRGEPLLHPQLSDMIRYAKDKGIIDVYINTNAMLLNENKFEQLIDVGLDRLSISIEGYEKEVYERYRTGASFEKLLNHVSRLIDIRNQRKVLHPQIRIQTVLFNELKRDFDEYVAFWSKFADEVSYLDGREETEEREESYQIADWACPFLWQRMTILWNGTVLPCLMHGIYDFTNMILGHISDCSMASLWHGDKANRLRELHKNGKSHELQACRQCSYRAMEIQKNLT